MGEHSKIEWTDHTFNPWIGCAKVSPACTHCYAETLARRTGSPELWQGARRRTSAANWRKPLRWNERTPGATVFCASLADVFESHVDPELADALDGWRADLFELIERCDQLWWLLLTKRPENVLRQVPGSWRAGFPRNVAIGTTIETQRYADDRCAELLQIPARLHFVSAEPLLGPVSLAAASRVGPLSVDYLRPQRLGRLADRPWIGWVISGGESGGRARPSHPNWHRTLRDECARAGVPYLFKQWGEWCPPASLPDLSAMSSMHDYVDEHPGQRDPARAAYVTRAGKTAAGRLLDRREHNGRPSLFERLPDGSPIPERAPRGGGNRG